MSLGATFDPAVDLVQPMPDVFSDPQYADTLEQIAPTITAKISEQQQPGESWADSLARLLPILAATEQQRELLNVQVERARQGLPPLNMSQYAAGVNVGISPDVKNLLIVGGIGLLAVMAFGAHRIGR